MPWRQLLSLLLMVSISSPLGATSVSSHQPGTASAFGTTSIASHQPGKTSAFGATNVSSHQLETVTKSMTRSGEIAVPSSGIGHHLMSTNGSSYQNGSGTGSLRESIKYGTEQEVQM